LLRGLVGLPPPETRAGHRSDRGDPRHQAGRLGIRAGGGSVRPGQVHDDLRLRAAEAALKLMPEVLRSIGFDPGPADEEFRARCQDALDVVQHDLDVTGYGQYRMRAGRGAGQYGVMHATWPDGMYWGGGEGMSRDMNGSGLLVNAAAAVSATIEDVHEIEWPVCAVHSDGPRTRWEPVALARKVAVWQCTRGRHVLAPVGQLTADIAKTL
jgi:hypothetical protein